MAKMTNLFIMFYLCAKKRNIRQNIASLCSFVVKVNVGQVKPVGTVALSPTRSGAVLAATTAAAFAIQGAHHPADGEEERSRKNYTYYDCLYHINKLPIWNTSALTIQARPIV